MKKNIIACIAIIAMGTVLWAQTALAATVSASNASANAGQSGVTISISASDMLGTSYKSCDLRLAYDTNVLSVSSVNMGSAVSGWQMASNPNVAGAISIALFGTTSLSQSGGQLVNIVFNVRSTAPAGSSAIRITSAVFDEQNANTQGGILTVISTTTTHALTINATNGSVSKSPSQTSYNDGAQVTLTASPASGYNFTGWTGDVTGTTNPVVVTMNADKVITANFSPIIVPSGSSISISDTSGFPGQTGVTSIISAGSFGSSSVIGVDATLSYNSNDLEITSATKGIAVPSDWNLVTNINNTAGSLVIVLYGIDGLPSQGGALVNVTFNVKNSAVVGTSSVLSLSNVKFNETVITAITNGAFTIVSNNNTPPVTTEVNYALTVTADHGTILRDPDETSYKPGTKVTLTAMPATGRYFAGWTGGLTGSSNPATITMDDNKNITANFGISDTYSQLVSSVPGTTTTGTTTGIMTGTTALTTGTGTGSGTTTPSNAGGAVSIVSKDAIGGGRDIGGAEKNYEQPPLNQLTYNEPSAPAPAPVTPFTAAVKQRAKEQSAVSFTGQTKEEGTQKEAPKATAPKIKIKPVWKFLGIWHKYQLTLEAGSPVRIWVLGEKQRLPFWLHLNKGTGVISGFVWGKGKYKINLQLITNDYNIIKADCDLNVE